MAFCDQLTTPRPTLFLTGLNRNQLVHCRTAGSLNQFINYFSAAAQFSTPPGSHQLDSTHTHTHTSSSEECQAGILTCPDSLCGATPALWLRTDYLFSSLTVCVWVCVCVVVLGTHSQTAFDIWSLADFHGPHCPLTLLCKVYTVCMCGSRDCNYPPRGNKCHILSEIVFTAESTISITIFLRQLWGWARSRRTHWDD